VSAGYGRMVVRGLLLLLASLMLLSLMSYHPNDPNILSKGGIGGSYKNWCGFIGANLAGLPVALVGLGALLMPAYIGWEALSQLRQRWHRRIAWLVLALSLWTFLGVFGTIDWPPKGGAISEQIQCGGWIGYVLWPRMLKILGPVGLPITLATSFLLSLLVTAPALTRAIGKLFAKWFGNRAWPWLKPIPSKGFQAFITMVKRPFLTWESSGQKTVPELDAADGYYLRVQNEHQQAVEALEKAEREAAQFRRSNHTLPKEIEFPTIYSINMDAFPRVPENQPTPIQPIVLKPVHPDAQLPSVLTVEPEPKPINEAIPSPTLLRNLPPPPKPKPPLVEPKISKGFSGYLIEQKPLGLTEPTPNVPIPEIPDYHEKSNHTDRFDLPPRRLFNPPSAAARVDTQLLEETKNLIQRKLAEFKVKGQITGMQPGPVVTVYEFSPDPGVPLAKVLNMEEDLALGLRAEKVRIDRVMGKNVVGIEVPNAVREIISFRDILDSPDFQDTSRTDRQSILSLALGKDLGGKPVVADLAKMPHLLIGGSTGSGKSVGVNAMICSILLRARADEVKFILIDPKNGVELGLYEDIPHLWAPVVTDMKEAGRVLKWVVAQMEERYKRLTILAVRNLEQFNTKVIEAGGVIDLSDRTPNPKWPDRPLQLEPLPYIVVIIDELADLMMVCRSEVEESIARIAQKARAIGIHLVLATQRPSVDIVTGVIKANLPARLSYRVNTKIDSRTILDSGGGEQLLGKGDALFLAPGTARTRRIHAPMLTEDEILKLVEWLKARGRPDYNQALIKAMETEESNNTQSADSESSDSGDDIYDRAVAVVKRERKASTSLLQRKLSIGYGRAARIIDRMEEEGIIGPDRGTGKPREVFIEAEVF